MSEIVETVASAIRRHLATKTALGDYVRVNDDGTVRVDAEYNPVDIARAAIEAYERVRGRQVKVNYVERAPLLIEDDA